MAEQTDSGTSKSGDFAEALSAAIDSALQRHSSDFVAWRLKEVSGAFGGFVAENTLTVTITSTTGIGRDRG